MTAKPFDREGAGVAIRRADPSTPEMRAIIAAHLAHSAATTPPESIFAMTPEQLAGQPGLEFWSIHDGDRALGCGALKPIGDGLVEVKSVHVLAEARGRGLARRMMQHLEAEARRQGYRALVLETGSEVLQGFEAARALYHGLGYVACDVLPGYAPDRNSAFLRRDL